MTIDDFVEEFKATLIKNNDKLFPTKNVRCRRGNSNYLHCPISYVASERLKQHVGKWFYQSYISEVLGLSIDDIDIIMDSADNNTTMPHFNEELRHKLLGVLS